MEKQIKLVTFRVFYTSVKAHLVKTRLESEQIECYLFDENINSLNMAYSMAVGGIKLKIKDTDVNRAEELIKDFESLEVIDDENNKVKCPKCNSNEFYSGYTSLRSLKGILSAILSLFLVVIPFYCKFVYKCTKCGYEFTDKNKIN